jgi:hypothetical protein
MARGYREPAEARLDSFGRRVLPASACWGELRRWWLRYPQRANTGRDRRGAPGPRAAAPGDRDRRGLALSAPEPPRVDPDGDSDACWARAAREPSRFLRTRVGGRLHGTGDPRGIPAAPHHAPSGVRRPCSARTSRPAHHPPAAATARPRVRRVGPRARCCSRRGRRRCRATSSSAGAR